MENVKSNIGGLLEKSSYSKEDLMKRYSRSRNTISKWCNGSKYPSIPELLDLADLFGVSLEDLFEREYEEEEPDILKEHIYILDLSKRVEMLLMRNGINTVENLINNEIWRIPRIGPKSLKEVNKKIEEIKIKIEDKK